MAIVENGTRPDQRVLTGRLGRPHDLAVRHYVKKPGMVYVGEVARRADELGWYGSAPLSFEDDFQHLTATA